MPRETIRTSERFALSVGWESGRDMQVGVVLPKRDPVEPKSVLEFLDPVYVASAMLDFQEKIKSVTFDVDTDAPDQTDLTVLGTEFIERLVELHPFTDGYWTSPSRYEVNQFIKLLRRARDSAYGKDE